MYKQILIVTCILLLISEITARSGKLKGKKKSWKDSKCRCGVSINERVSAVRKPRIVGGSSVQPSYKYPWMVSILKDNNPHCAGAIISQSYVLTAAHCFVSGEIKKYLDSIQKMCVVSGFQEKQPCYLEPSRFQVAFIESTEYRKNFAAIRSFIIHPKFEFTQKIFDIALMKLQKTVSCSKFVRPICLPYIPRVKAGTEVVASGWGRTFQGTGVGEQVSLTLKEAKMKILLGSECVSHDFNNKNHRCVKGYSQGTCTGDSGAPLAVERKGKFYIIGVLSYGMSRHCNTSTPQYFSEVKSFLPWITKEIKD